MLKLYHVAMIAALTVGVAALAQRAPGGGAGAGAGAGAAGSAGSTEPEKKASSRLLRGDIEAVDIENKTVTVKAKKGGEMVTVVVETDAKTQFVVNDKPGTLVDLRRGMVVTVIPDVGMATKVTAKTAPKQTPRRTPGSTTRPAAAP